MRKNKMGCLVFILGCLLGAVLFIAIYGIQVLDFSYTDWLTPRSHSDLSQHYLGWVEYRASDWHFPLGLIDNIVYPEKISVFYTDSIPLFAFCFKVLSGILPDKFQYFGLFGIICYSLMGGFAASIIFYFTNHAFASVVSSLFFSGSLLILWRMYEHTALSAHFIILASFYLWKCKENKITTLVSAVLWNILSAVAIMTQAYFIPMVWGIMLCDILEQVLRKEYRRGIITIITTVITTVTIGYLFGMFYGNTPVSGDFFGIFSFNLNGFINSQGYSKIINALPLSNGFQYEGLAYLGAGILFLVITLAVMLIAKIILKVRPYRDKGLLQCKGYKKILPDLVCAVGFLLASLSNQITWGSHSLVVPLPQSIINIWSIFRSNGRLIWPVYYGITLVVVVGTIRLFRNKPFIAGYLISLALCLNIYDYSDFIASKHARFATTDRYTYISPFTDTAWEEIGKKYQHIMYYPHVHNIYNNALGYDIQIFAFNHKMTLNCVYLARDVTPAVDQRTMMQFNNMQASGELDTDTIFIFWDQLPADSHGLHFYKLNDLIVGTPSPLEGSREIALDSLFEKRTIYTSESNDHKTMSILLCDDGYDNVLFPVWSNENGQDDIIWYEAHKNENDLWECTVDLSNHQVEGIYVIHAYANIGGNQEGITGTDCYISYP